VTTSPSPWDVSILDGSGDCRGEAHALRRELEGYGLRVRIVLGPPLTHPDAPLEPDDASASVTLLREPLDLADGRATRIMFVFTVAPAEPCGIAAEAGVLDEDDVRPLAGLVAAYLGRPVGTDRP
jgi:hypothetical protein